MNKNKNIVVHTLTRAKKKKKRKKRASEAVKQGSSYETTMCCAATSKLNEIYEKGSYKLEAVEIGMATYTHDI